MKDISLNSFINLHIVSYNLIVHDIKIKKLYFSWHFLLHIFQFYIILYYSILSKIKILSISYELFLKNI